MLLARTARSLIPCLLSASTLATLTWLNPHVAQAQTPLQDSAVEQPASPGDDDLRPLTQDGSVLSIAGGQRLMSEANNAVSAQNYDLAVQKLQQARQVFNQLSNFYQELAASFSGIDNRISESQRQQALETAQLRDQATYQLALVHRAQNKPELAVPLLIQIIRSQQPTRDLGELAYRQLFELGFVNSPYERRGASSNAPAQAPEAPAQTQPEAAPQLAPSEE
jgi:cell division septum initiation protein DivIVA